MTKEQIIKEQLPLIARIATHYRRCDEAEGVATLVLVEVAQRVANQEIANLEFYLRSAIRQAILRVIRQNQKRADAERKYAMSHPEDQGWQQQKWTGLTEAQKQKRSQMRLRDRLLLRLRFDENLSFDEIAEIVSLSRRHVLRRLNELLQELTE